MRNRLPASALVLTAILTAACSGDGGAPAAPVLTPARIVLSQASVAVTAHAGGADPAPVYLQITNGGDVALDGLQVAVDYAGTGPEGWLVAALDGRSAPATLRLEFTVQDLAEGNFEARVLISSSAASADGAVTVRLDLQPPLLPQLRFQGAHAAGDTVRLNSHLPLAPFHIENVGTAPATFFLTLLHTLDREVDDGDRRDQRWEYTLGPGETEEVDLGAITRLTSIRHPLGTQYFAFVLDLEGEVRESDESDNVFLVPFTLRGWDVDLSVEGEGTVTASPEPGPLGYPSYSEIYFTAVPDEGWGLTHFITGDPVDPYRRSSPIRVVVGPGDLALTAVFHPAPVLAGQVSDDGRADLTWSYPWPCAVRSPCPGEAGPADRYELGMDRGDGMGFQVVFTSENTRQSPFTHSLRLEPGSYSFRVRAVGDGWQSPWNEPLELSYGGPQAPAAPSQLEVTLQPRGFSGADLYLTWRDNASNEESYLVEVARGDGRFYLSARVPANAESNTQRISEAVARSQESVQVRVRAANAVGTSGPTEEVSVSWADREGALKISNWSVYPVFSVRLNGEELLPSDQPLAGAESVVGGSLERVLSPGSYVVEIINGYQDEGGWHPLHGVVDTVQVYALSRQYVKLDDPSASELMTRWSPSHTWTGSYVNGALQPQSVGLTFREDRSWSLVVNGRATAAGDYYHGLAGPDAAEYSVKIQLETGRVGLLREIEGVFELEMEAGRSVQLRP